MKKTILILAFVFIAGSMFAWNAADLYPLSIGNTWNMREIDYGYGDTTMSVQTVVGTTELLGHTTHILVTDDEDTSYIQNRTDGLYFVANFEGFGGWVEMLIAPASFSNGDSWIMFTIDTVMEYGGGYNMQLFMQNTITVIGTENVTVPAGTYNNCIKFQQDFVHINIMEMGGTIISSDSSSGTDAYTWMKEHVGMIKSENLPDSDSMIVDELVSFSGDGMKEAQPSIANELTLTTAPNPFNSAVNIQADEGAEVFIYDSNGRQLDFFVSDGSNNWQPDTDVPSGTITIKAVMDNAEKTTTAIYMK